MQVAWQHLIDSFLSCEISAVQEAVNHKKIPNISRISERNDDEVDKDFLRRIKVLMVPLQGIISNKCNISVHMSCLITWHYLLHKLDILVNHPLILQTTFKPFTEVVFSKKPYNENICLWKPCLDLFDQYISGVAKSKGMDLIPTECHCDVPLSCFSSSFPWVHSIAWLPLKISELDFPLMIIRTIVSHNLTTQIDHPEVRTFVLSSAVRIFKSVVEVVKLETKLSDVPCNNIQLCLSTILKFIKEFCEVIISSRSDWNDSYDFPWMVFQFVVAVREELGYFGPHVH